MHIEKVSLIEKAQELFEMDKQTFIQDFDYPPSKVEHTISYLKDCEVYFVYEDKTPIGSFSFKESGGQVEIMQVALLPQHQGKGYGKKIVAYLLNVVKGKKVWLVTHPKNTPAIIVYLKAGFVISEWKENYYGDGQPRLLLRLK